VTKDDIHIIARAVIRADDCILIARCKGASNTFLPGGHVRTRERMHDAIARELREEFGELCSVGEYIGAIEHTFTDSDVTQHEINHLFEVVLPNVKGASPLKSLEPHLEFFWHPIKELGAINLKPEPVAEVVQSSRAMAQWASTLRNGPVGPNSSFKPKPLRGSA
jgi:8-oxo-dGTP pyrophosphatase MutT (NUDIX family)